MYGRVATYAIDGATTHDVITHRYNQFHVARRSRSLNMCAVLNPQSQLFQMPVCSIAILVYEETRWWPHKASAICHAEIKWNDIITVAVWNDCSYARSDPQNGIIYSLSLDHLCMHAWGCHRSHFGILKSALIGFSPKRGGVLSATSMAVIPNDHTSARAS